MKRVLVLCAALALGGLPLKATAAPIITSVTPSPLTVGSGPELLSIFGQFAAGDEVAFERPGSSLLEPLVVGPETATEIVATLPASDLNTPGTAELFVFEGDVRSDGFFVEIVPAAVAEPASLAMLALGLAGLVAVGRRKGAPRPSCA
jgi:hypothetical protein